MNGKAVFKAVAGIAVAAHLAFVSTASGEDLVLPVGGKVSVELLSSNAALHNTLLISTPTARVVPDLSGCEIEAQSGMADSDRAVLSEKSSQHGCRATLDADRSTPGVQPFAAGATLQFQLCTQIQGGQGCGYLWSSDPGANSDHFEHVTTIPLHEQEFPGRIFKLRWEDLDGGGDADYDDLVAVVRVEQDSDGDGLWDDWETLGIDTTGDGVVDLDLPALGADPLHKDVFVEIDWMDCVLGGCAAGDTHNHKPLQEAIDKYVVLSFAGANVANPDGTPGIRLHVEVGNAIPHEDYVGLGCGSGDEEFNRIKEDPANFGTDNPRRFAYHYGLFVHEQSAGNAKSSGCGEQPGNDFEASLGHEQWSDPNGNQVLAQAAVLMHELGHNLGLLHGGGDEVNEKPNYRSVMNYAYQFRGIGYSRGKLPDLDETNLSEPKGIGLVGITDPKLVYAVPYFCPDGTKPVTAGVSNLPINWSCDTDALDEGVVSDLNKDFKLQTLEGFWDWANLKYDFQNSTDFRDGAHLSTSSQEEVDSETYKQQIPPDLAISQSATPGPALTGSYVVYTLNVTNQQLGEASGVTVTDRLPRGMSFVFCAASEGGVCDGAGNRRTVTFPSLAGGASAKIFLVARVNCMAADGARLDNTAQVAFAGSDPTPDDDVAVSTLAVANPAPLLTGVTATPATLWPPRRQWVDVAVGYEATDSCGEPLCSLAVGSNEPALFPDGRDRTPDWQVVDAHHVRLRAERSSLGTGRRYTVTVSCRDLSGRTSQDAVTVAVPISAP